VQSAPPFLFARARARSFAPIARLSIRPASSIVVERVRVAALSLSSLSTARAKRIHSRTRTQLENKASARFRACRSLRSLRETRAESG
jgi:hypothetical protein